MGLLSGDSFPFCPVCLPLSLFLLFSLSPSLSLSFSLCISHSFPLCRMNGQLADRGPVGRVSVTLSSLSFVLVHLSLTSIHPFSLPSVLWPGSIVSSDRATAESAFTRFTPLPLAVFEVHTFSVLYFLLLSIMSPTPNGCRALCPPPFLLSLLSPTLLLIQVLICSFKYICHCSLLPVF